jgi:transketolase
MSHLQVIYVFTHDSVFLGEDGPTHQPVEQLAGLRLVPNLAVVRPADGPEVAMAWALALGRKVGPTALILTRQDVPLLQRGASFSADVMFRGAYLLSEAVPRGGSASGGSALTPPAGGAPLVLIASGSEVAAVQQAQVILAAKGIASRVVSAPCPGLFLEQPEDYRRSVVPPGARTVVVEAARLDGWERLAGCAALMIGVDRFGASAPWKVIAEKLGFTGPQIADRIMRWLGA